MHPQAQMVKPCCNVTGGRTLTFNSSSEDYAVWTQATVGYDTFEVSL
jgi:hypothetical protein